MKLFFEIFFWSCLVPVFHSYISFPISLKWFKIKKRNYTEKLPEGLSILMAAHNEEKVIKAKIESFLKLSKSKELKIEFLIGSDNSTDHTNQIIQEYAIKHPEIKLFDFKERKGKPGIINELVLNAKYEILMLTDANVLFSEDLLIKILPEFQDKKTGLIGANIISEGLKKDGISISEDSYLQRETKIKYLEGELWGSMMGAFGACYFLRKELYQNVPKGFIADDFFICIKVIEQNYDARLLPNAICYEDVSNKMMEEFRRKKRIATGNWQNLFYFKSLLLKLKIGVAYSFISHKIFRWISPVLLIFSFILLIVLNLFNILLYKILLAIALLILLIPILDYFLQKININFLPFRFISHFLAMNLALLNGLINYSKGVKQNTWTPTQRNQ